MLRPRSVLLAAALAAPVVPLAVGCRGSSVVSPDDGQFRLLPGLAKGPGQTPLPESFMKKVENDPFPSAAQRGLLGQ